MKYNKSEIMKRAWEIKKQDSRNIFAQCLKMAWAEAKKAVKAVKAVKFVNHMTVAADGYERELVRWRKSNMDRVYINGGSRRGDGFVDIKNGTVCLRGGLTYQQHIADMILAMEF